MMELDHLVVTGGDRDVAAAWVGRCLGAAPSGGGAHAVMGTHNRLWGLGPDYLEAIAPDPAVGAPGRPRWFELDGREGAPALTHWVARVPDIEAATAAAPGEWEVLDAERDGLRWRMAVAPSGRTPLGGAHPQMIQWLTEPAFERLPVQGRLTALLVICPEAEALRAALPLADGRVRIEAGPRGMRAEFEIGGATRRL
ncbi:glyoxalase-like protein [Hasllibacter halocynthiae]|uniref:Glyoxalase-like protein n=1 Tax=Hasllibacter halocynthiae TaxID=595589 RepID=A0A2T0X6N3_9RHOB|nr:VOC family protein [Hasllibacter halocynthiae]PRY94583.1 glyoxalase-like protein [Hasllibacter halocynthiae]